MDLVKAIASHGGWLAYGWDFDDADDTNDDDGDWIYGDDEERKWEKLYGVELKTDSFSFLLPETNSSTRENNEFAVNCFDEGILEQQRFGSSMDPTSSSIASSSGRPIDIKVEDESGIDGILKRLEKERSFSYTVTCKDSNIDDRILSRDYELSSSEPYNVVRSSYMPELENFLYGIRRNGFAHSMDQRAMDVRNVKKESSSTAGPGQNHIHSRLRYLESELSSVLSSLRSQKDTVASLKGEGSSLKELHKLTDAREFVETEIMNTQDRLRSTKAKLAVLEGKMALQVIESQKIIEEKQKRIDATQRAVHLLRTAYVVWPNSASEVLLAGSFDGWSSQIKFGIFSLHLNLYPGQYEIKFIVDGVWKIDPLRPIVYNHGFENNLLIVS
ncbi:unnamed protein product [Spirodela intermedia]|uniref:AMP-activated protein kinase glycogen-binding domain-containing protein n=1 Tax=Spirodela intermedia TaxID=51605 RepID=A0A7I8I879_SPIIN|nr:unnamed protein product [Spirodela intermedia]CAA6653674.1 unnamed protein product [Spirodela intermedia]